MKDRWLVISYFANIDAMAPSHHIDDRLAFLEKRGIKVDLLSSPCGPRLRDLHHTRVPSLAPSGIRYEVRHFLRRRTRRKLWAKFWETLLLLPVYPLYFVEKIFLKMDSTWSWFLLSSVAATFLALRRRPEVIYATGGSVAAHLAAMVASRLTGIPYIAEFQDPLVYQYPKKLERRIIPRIERAILNSASTTVFLTREAAGKARAKHPGRNVTHIYAGGLPFNGQIAYEKGETFTLSHFGTLAGSRNLKYLLEALSGLLDKQEDMRGRFRLDLYGHVSSNVKVHIRQFPFPDLVRMFGKIAREDAGRHMSSADALLLVQNIDDVSAETIPSKTYEYLLAGRPILALVYRNIELKDMLAGLGHIAVEADDVAAIREGLATYVARWREGRLDTHCAGSPYTVVKAVDELISFAYDNVKC